MIEIQLTKGYVTAIDDDDSKYAALKWRARIDHGGRVYAVRSAPRDEAGRRPSILLHRAILGVTDPTIEVDHFDGDTLNNRKRNLREATRSMNQRNRLEGERGASSKFLGVSWASRDRRWRAHIWSDGRLINIGSFNAESEANAARLETEARLWGIQPRRALAHGTVAQ